MLFASHFFLFAYLPCVLFLYFLLPKAVKNIFLLAASLLFYAWGDTRFFSLLLIIILLNYLFGIFIDRAKKNAKYILAAAIVTNVGILLYYKFSSYLPLGLSFIVFHVISYVVDIYRKKTRAENNFLDFALYISFFPRLIAGPIVRYIDIQHELKKRVVSSGLFAEGVSRFIGGFGKKVIIANPLGAVADALFDLPPGELSTSLAWLGVASYALQIYFDFSGYSDMAIGIGKMFGFNFKENFNYPYVSRSIQEFWRRWHISLSSWFRDYVYIPLGGNRLGSLRTSINILIVFLLTGFWHGQGWTFIAWGLYYGLFLIIEKGKIGKIIERLWWPIRNFYAITIVFFGWILFRSNSLSQAVHFFKSMFFLEVPTARTAPPQVFMNAEFLLTFFIAILLSFPVVPYIKKKFEGMRAMMIVETFALIIIFLYSIIQLAGATYSPFIYFKF